MVFNTKKKNLKSEVILTLLGIKLKFISPCVDNILVRFDITHSSQVLKILAFTDVSIFFSNKIRATSDFRYIF